MAVGSRQYGDSSVTSGFMPDVTWVFSLNQSSPASERLDIICEIAHILAKGRHCAGRFVGIFLLGWRMIGKRRMRS